MNTEVKGLYSLQKKAILWKDFNDTSSMALHIPFWHNLRFQYCVEGARCNFFIIPSILQRRKKNLCSIANPALLCTLSSALNTCPFFQQYLWTITTNSSNFFFKWKLFNTSPLLSAVGPLVLWQQARCCISVAWVDCGGRENKLGKEVIADWEAWERVRVRAAPPACVFRARKGWGYSAIIPASQKSDSTSGTLLGPSEL